MSGQLEKQLTRQRYRGAKFGVAQRSDERKYTAKHPNN